MRSALHNSAVAILDDLSALAGTGMLILLLTGLQADADARGGSERARPTNTFWTR